MINYRTVYKLPDFDSRLYKFSCDYPVIAILVGIMWFFAFVFGLSSYMPSFEVGFFILLLSEIAIASVYPIVNHNIKYIGHNAVYTFGDEEVTVVVDDGKSTMSVKYSDINNMVLKYYEDRRTGIGYYLEIEMCKRTHMDSWTLLLSDDMSAVIKFLEDKVGVRVEPYRE
jgi:hypothetical protein